MKRFSLFLIFALCVAPALAGPFGFFGRSEGGCVNGQCQLQQPDEAPVELVRRPTIKLSASSESIKAGESVTVTWEATNATSATLNGQAVELSGTQAFTPAETATYTLKATNKRKSATADITVAVESATNPDTPTPTPVEGFSLSAVGIGSAFAVDDTLSAASRDHEIGAFLSSQNGRWTIILDEVMAKPHPEAFDKWVAALTAAGVAKPAVIWNNQGKILKIESVAGKTKTDILAMAKACVPATRGAVVIRGQVRPTGLLPTPKGKKWSGPKVSALLKPLAAADCPSVDLSSQVLYYKNQTGGTCVLNAFAGACEAADLCLYGRVNCIEFSPYFLANLTNGYNGTYAAEAADKIQQYGNLPFSAMDPYDDLPSGWKKKAAENKCLAVYGPVDSDPAGYIRAGLHRGYIVPAGISVGSGFDPDISGYISYDRGAGRYVNHEIRVVGWDQQKKRFKIANSWGKDWGIDGFAWLDEAFFNDDTDIWIVVGMSAASSFQFYSPSAN